MNNEIFDDEFMNDMLLNPDLYGLEKPIGGMEVDDEEDDDDEDLY